MDRASISEWVVVSKRPRPLLIVVHEPDPRVEQLSTKEAYHLPQLCWQELHVLTVCGPVGEALAIDNVRWAAVIRATAAIDLGCEAQGCRKSGTERRFSDAIVYILVNEAKRGKKPSRPNYDSPASRALACLMTLWGSIGTL
jgi:hypothetical protein